MSIKKNFFAPLASGLGATRRAAMLLLVMMLTATMAQTTGAQTTSTINVGGTDYTLFTGFTATDGNGRNYAKLVDGNTTSDWSATKNYDDPNAPANDFAGGTADPAFVEFHADEPIVPKGYVLTCDHENAGFWKPVEWALKAKLNEGDEWTTIHSSTTTLGAGKTFEIACDNDDNNEYQYFRLEVYEVGTTYVVDLDELQFYGLLPTYTHLTVKAATCMATGINVDCYRRNSDGKYFTDNTGETEIPESDVIAPIIPHTGEHHEATDVNIEYWQCSMCGKYFSDEGYTTEITEEQTKIYRTITIDASISGLVTVGFGRTQALAGANVLLRVMDDRIDISTLKVNDGAVEVIPDGGDWYKFTMPAADVTVTAEVAQSNADGDILTGSIKHRVTITDGASITLNNATISGSIVCEGSATITLVGTNSVSGATNKAGIQIGGSGTTLTIRGEGSLTVNGGDLSAGIGLSSLMNYDSNVSSGDIVIEGGTITATGGSWGAGIGIGTVKNTNNDNSTSVQFGNITIKGGSVTATGGTSGDGIGKGYSYSGPTISIGTVTIYDGIDKVDASSITNFGNVVYMHVDGETETNVTASKADHFTIIEDGNRRIIVQKVNPAIAEIPDQTYTGSAITPEPLVIAGSLSLTKDEDYTYSYTNNTNVGTATVRATFQGTYASLGYVEKTFTITPSTIMVSVAGSGTVTIDDKSASDGEAFGVMSEKGASVVLTLAPESGNAVRSVAYGYTNSKGTNISGRKLPISDGTAMLTVPNDLKDGTGVTLTVTFAAALVGGADEASAVALTDATVTDFAGGWYKVESDITFDHTLNLLGDTHLTIADGKTMTVSTATAKGIDSDYTLNVGGAGALSVTASGSYPIAVRVGSYVQTGATVTASGFIGIRCQDGFTDFNIDNDFTITNGTVTATGTSDGIWADNDIILGWTNATDRICITASSYSGTVSVATADGHKLYDGNGNFLSGTVSDPAALNGKTLQPALSTAYITAEGTTADDPADAIVLSPDQTTLGAHNYVALGTLNYTQTGLTLTGDATLILADKCQMNVGTSSERINGRGINGYDSNADTTHDLTVTSQSLGSGMGTLGVYTTGNNKHGITAGTLTINGGNITADTNGNGAPALSVDNDVTINGGTVNANATGTNDFAFAIYAGEDFNYSGGNLTATAATGNAICADGNHYTFSWRTATDRITIGTTGLYATDGTTATFARLFTDASDNYYGGTLTDLSALAGKTLEAAETADFTVTLAPAGYGTYYDGNYDITLPAGTQARIVTARGDTDGTLSYATIADGDDTDNNTIPAGTAVMLCHQGGGTVTLTVHDADIDTRDFTQASGNTDGLVSLLHGSDVATQTTGGSLYYKLTYGSASGHEDLFGWYWGATDGAPFTSPAHKAWLALPASTVNARAFFALPDFGEASGITTTNYTNFTNSTGAWYTLDGKRLNGVPTAKGLYINNGKKVAIK